MTRYRSLFMGTPDVAVPFLDALNDQTDVQLVVSQPDRPRGRKQVLQPTPVKARAAELGLPVEQPVRLKGNGLFVDRLDQLNLDVILVVAYGRILPLEILELPRKGCLNIHFSLLPAYRGAAPVNWAIVNGETETGVTLMKMDAGMDTGPVVGTVRTPIDPTEQAPSLFQRLTGLGIDLFKKTLSAYMTGDRVPEPQPATGVSMAPMMSRDDGVLDFSRPALELHNRVRGFQPWPGTRASWNGRMFKILETGLPRTGAERPVGSVIVMGNQIDVQCGDGMRLPILRIQPESKKAMDAPACINGGYLKDGDQ